MTAYLRNPLTIVWAFLAAITVFSWWVGRGHGIEYQLNTAITVGVLAMASLKAWLVIDWFMEVRRAPVWLKRAAYGWVIGLLGLLILFYLFPL